MEKALGQTQNQKEAQITMSNMIPQYDTKLFTEIWNRVSEFIYDYQHVGIPTTISTSNATTLYYLLYARYANNPIANYDEEQFKYKIFSIIFQYGPTWEKKLSIQQTLRGLQLSDLIDDGSFSELFGHQGANGSTKTTSSNSTRTIDNDTTSTGTVTIDTDDTTTDVNNHAFNPGTTPATDAYTPLNYINDQTAKKNVIDGTQETTNDLAGTSDTTDQVYANGTDTISGNDSSTDQTNRTFTRGKLKAYEHLIMLLDSDVTGEFVAKFKVCFKQFVLPERTWIYVSEEDEEDDGQ